MRAVLSFVASSLVAACVCAACAESTPPGGAMHAGESEEAPAPVTPRSASSSPPRSPKSIIGACAWGNLTCALENSGDVLCWGRIEGAGVATPRRVAQVPDAVSIDCGSSDVWIVRRTGDLAHVGFHGQSPSSTSPPEAELHDVVALRHLGPDGVCALRRDGHVTCWGWLDFSDKKPTVTIAALEGAAQLECSRSTCCAVLRDGAVRCFGNNDKYLGVDGATARPPPIALDPARSVTIADRYACAVSRDGARSCWGHPSTLPSFGGDAPASRLVRMDGDLCTLDGSGKLACEGRTLPTNLGEGIADVIDGYGHTCVLKQSGALGCWGSNEYGELGDGIPLVRSAPARIDGLDDVTELNVAHTNVCARKKDGTTWCWGDGLGQPTKLAVTGPSIPAQYAAGCTHQQGKVHCVQMNLGGNEWQPVTADPLGGPKDLQSAAIDRAPNLYLVDRAGGVSAWFSMNYNGMAARAQAMSAPSKVRGLVPTGLGACALLDGGRVACFEDERHEHDEKFLTKTPASRAFREIPSLAGVVQLAGGSSHACARTSDGRVLCWHLSGTRAPREVEGARGATDIASNDAETCAVVHDEMMCWTGGAAPVRVAGLPPIVRAGAGRESRCGLARDGHVWCSGTDTYGELGMGRQRRVADRVIEVAGVGR